MENINLEPPIIDQKQELEKLADSIKKIKANIQELRAAQLQAEERVAAIIGVKEEGTISQKTPTFKVSSVGGLTRNLELHDPNWYKERLGERFEELVSTKLSIKVAEFRRASSEEQAILMENMVIKPKKPTIKVELREEE